MPYEDLFENEIDPEPNIDDELEYWYHIYHEEDEWLGDTELDRLICSHAIAFF